MKAGLIAGCAIFSWSLLVLAVPPVCSAFPPNSYAVGSLNTFFSSQLKGHLMGVTFTWPPSVNSKHPSSSHFSTLTLLHSFFFFFHSTYHHLTYYTFVTPLALPPPLEQARPWAGPPFCLANGGVPCCGRPINLCCNVVTEIQFLPAFPLVWPEKANNCINPWNSALFQKYNFSVKRALRLHFLLCARAHTTGFCLDLLPLFPAAGVEDKTCCVHSLPSELKGQKVPCLEEGVWAPPRLLSSSWPPVMVWKFSATSFQPLWCCRGKRRNCRLMFTS